MNTNALKRFAKYARIKLLDQVGRKLEFVLTHDTAELRGKQKEVEQLKNKVADQGKEQVIEMVAYTWFNRLMALRFMDANGYTLPKVVTPTTGMSNPEILQNALGGNIDVDLKLDRQRLNDLLDGKTAAADAHTEAYKMLLVAICNQWHTAMPFMFERISDYTELLLPDDLLSDYSIVADIRNGMSDEDCRQEELIGWLYQFYIADKKDDVFEGLKKNIKITAENIPAATQLFTPRWIVRYMVENTLGKLWLTFRPNSKLRQHMPYYIEAPEGNAPAPIPEGIKGITDITFLDPCQGSGHVLVYAFDLFTKIYEEEGYNTNEIPALILEHNLYGIDLDERAAQLAAFALTMKARSYYTRFLRKPVQPHVIALENCNFNSEEVNRMVAKGLLPFFQDLYDDNYTETQSKLYKTLADKAKKEKKSLPGDTFSLLSATLGSYLSESRILAYVNKKDKQTCPLEIEDIHHEYILAEWIGSQSRNAAAQLTYEIGLFNQLDNIGSLFQPTNEVVELLTFLDSELSDDDVFEKNTKSKLLKGLEQAEYLSRQYHCVVTNPPYLGGGGMNQHIGNFVKFKFPRSKSDLMACFMERCLTFNPNNGKIGMINQHSWMFLSSYVELRPYLIDNFQFESMLHLGPRTFPEIGGEVVQNTAFVFGNYLPLGKGNFIRLTDFANAQLKDEKTIEAIKNPHCGWFYKANQKDFEKIPGSPITYWLKQGIVNLFEKEKIKAIFEGKEGVGTRDDSRFLRYFWEVSSTKIGISRKWIRTDKAGGFKKWYGNLNVVMNWENNGYEIKNFKDEKGKLKSRPQNLNYMFKEAISWGKVSAGIPSFRFRSEGLGFNDAAPSLFGDVDKIIPLGYLNSKVARFLISASGDTINYTVGTIESLPYIINDETSDIYIKCQNCLWISIKDWNRMEVSWDFQINELISYQYLFVKDALNNFKSIWKDQFNMLHENEEYINQYFIEVNGIQEDLKPNIPLEEITILQEESKIINGELFIDPIPVLLQLLSYSIGCIFGRYSLDKPGLILANQGETLQDYLTQIPNPSFMPDEDNIIPVLDGEWFSDDIVGRFKVFLKAAFGDEHFEENINYIENTIGKDIRKYFVKDFYNDHIKRYKKRPIYWMFSSPKGHFKALIYMHRYQPDLCSKLLNDYLQAFISKLESAKQTQTMLSLREDISAREKTLAIKDADKYEAMIKDCREYEKTLFAIATQKISIDLDDGVKVNYQKFKDVLVPIKGLEKDEE